MFRGRRETYGTLVLVVFMFFACFITSAVLWYYFTIHYSR